MKFVLIIILVLLASTLGILLGLGFLDNFGFLIGMFIIFPIAYIFTIIVLGKGKKEHNDKEEKHNSKWD